MTRPPQHVIDALPAHERNIQDRKDAQAVIDLCAEQPQTLHFWRCLADIAAEKAGYVLGSQMPASVQPEIWTDEQAHHFERFTRLNFGKHNGKTVLEILSIDPNYLAWCADNLQTRFGELSREYVKTRRYGYACEVWERNTGV